MRLTITTFMFTALAVSGTACGGGSDGSGDDGSIGGVNPGSRNFNYCMGPGQSKTHTAKIPCFVGSLSQFDSECVYHFNAVTGAGSAFPSLNVSPAFVNVPEGDSINLPITMIAGGQEDYVTLQATHQNCRAQPNCRPTPLALVTVSNLCP